MDKITVLYFSTAMAATKLTFETFTVSDDGLKLSDLARLVVSRHPNTGIDRVLEGARWSVDGEMVYADLDAFVLRGGEEVAVIPRVSGG
jgi:molybdopterin converting factor small subunit